MAEFRATPYRYPAVGSVNELVGGLLGFMKDPRRTQQLQGLAGLLESTGVPKTLERLAYGEPLTNIQQANVPMLKPETAEALLTLLPVPVGANKAAKALDPVVQRYGPKLEQTLLPAFESAYNRGGVTREMVEAMGNQTVSPLIVYQGTPHKFAPTSKNPLGEFDPTKIGSGEGAQAFGYGHYSAEAKKLGEYYRDILSQDIANPAKRVLEKFNGDVDAAIKASKDEAQRLSALDLTPQSGAAKRDQLLARQQSNIDELTKFKDTGEFTTGYLYEIDLPDEQIAKMLDWDKPLSKQPSVMAALNNFAENNVKAKIRNDIENEIRMSGVLPVDETGDDYMSLLFGQSDETIAKANQMLKQLADEQMAKIDFEPLIKNELEGMKPATMTWDATGKDFYEMLSKRRGSPENASAMFKEQGIPGIRYLDQGSRGTGEGTSNFVVFPGNEDLLTILRRNGGLLD